MSIEAMRNALSAQLKNNVIKQTDITLEVPQAGYGGTHEGPHIVHLIDKEARNHIPANANEPHYDTARERSFAKGVANSIATIVGAPPQPEAYVATKAGTPQQQPPGKGGPGGP